MTTSDAYATGTRIFVIASTSSAWQNLVTDRQLPLLPDGAGRADQLHTDPTTAMTCIVLVIVNDDVDTSGFLAPNPDQCPLCTGDATIVCREGSAPRNHKGEIEIPEDVFHDVLHGRQPQPVHDDVIDVRKPCPLCRSVDYALMIDDEIGWI